MKASFITTTPDETVGDADDESEVENELDHEQQQMLNSALQSVFSNNIHAPWTLEDDRYLLKEEARGKSIEDLCLDLKRGRGGVLARLRSLRDVKSQAFKRMFGETKDADATNSNQLRPVSDVIERILWDPSLNAADFYVGWQDRFEGISESPFLAPNQNIKGKERQFVKALPPHRIEYIKYKQRVVWSKSEKLDIFFGSGKMLGGANERIETVVATYQEWETEMEAQRAQSMTNIYVYCDLDGVLCDFDEGVRRVFGKKTDEISPKVLWSTLPKLDHFYSTLPWLEGGRELWSALRPFNPIILTGVPNGGNEWAARQKREWVARELGADVKIITCKSKEKHLFVKQNLLHRDNQDRNNNHKDPLLQQQQACKVFLIDDSLKLKEAWESEGGHFIHYTTRDPKNCVEDILKLLVAN